MSVTCQSGQSIKWKPYSFPFILLSKLRFFPLFCCRYFFIVCLPSHKASHLERVHLHALFTLWEGHSFPSSTTLRMLLKKPITMLMFLLMLLPLLKVLYSFFGYEWNTDKKFLVSIFYKFVTGLPIQSSPVQSITWDTVCHSLQNRVTFAAFFKANRGTLRSPRAYLRLTKISSVVQPKYGNSKQCRTSSVSTLSHLNLRRLMACLKKHSTNLPTYSHPKELKLSQRVCT